MTLNGFSLRNRRGGFNLNRRSLARSSGIVVEIASMVGPFARGAFGAITFLVQRKRKFDFFAERADIALVDWVPAAA